MTPLAIGALIGAGSSILGGALNAFSAKGSKDFQREMLYRQAQLQRQMQLNQNSFISSMWEKENDYNSPAAQRQRLVDAGLNPIYYGLDGNSTSVPSFGMASTPNAPSVPPAPDYSFIGDAALKAAQINNINADTEQKGGETDYTRSLKETEDLLRDGKAQLMGVNVSIGNQNVKESAARIVSIQKGLEETDARISDYASQVDTRTFHNTIEQAKYELDKKVRERLLTVSERQLALNYMDSVSNRIQANAASLNAASNSRNASTNEFVGRSQAGLNYSNSFTNYQLLPYRRNDLKSRSYLSSNLGSFYKGQEYRAAQRHPIEMVQLGAKAYQDVWDAILKPLDKTLDIGSKVFQFIPGL